MWDLIEVFEAFNLQSLLRNQNKHADRLVAIGAQYDIPYEISKNKGNNHVKVIVKPVVPNNAESWQVFESNQHIINFLREAQFSQPTNKNYRSNMRTILFN